jgi:hypothetical protein
MLTDQEKSSLRRHLKYGALGLSQGLIGGGTLGANTSWRAIFEWGDLESRLDYLAPVDEATLTGRPYGLLVFQGLDPNPGDQLVLRLSGGGISTPQDITVTAVNETRDGFAQKVGVAISRNVAVNAARIDAKATQSPGRTGIIRPISQLQFVGNLPFQIQILSSTGNIGVNLTADGSALTDVYQTIKKADIHGYLPLCNKLYALIGTATDRMGVDKADVFTARKKEYAERQAAYIQVINEMADFLHVQVNREVNGRSSNQGYM